MAPPAPRTPLRRVSQGSLFRLSRSSSRASTARHGESSAPAGLEFLPPALAELCDEAESLSTAAGQLAGLGRSLAEFNDAFASWMYVQGMNGLCVEWHEEPNKASFEIARRRAQIAAEEAQARLEAARREAERERERAAEAERTAAAETTLAADTTVNTVGGTKKVLVKKGKKPALSAKEKKARSLAIDKAVTSLPLEFRGNDPTLRKNVETVIELLMDASGRGLKILELVKPPDVNQARANKCLIALVNRKIVRKDNSSGAVLYHWIGIPE
ncbi:hypothetical protein PENSPDRAFT_605401 [Peniophora sp. CONT]|nr:hypothetical protein PENSPDRAFT_605401 [Peniophora sp. CONT]